MTGFNACNAQCAQLPAITLRRFSIFKYYFIYCGCCCKAFFFLLLRPLYVRAYALGGQRKFISIKWPQRGDRLHSSTAPRPIVASKPVMRPFGDGIQLKWQIYNCKFLRHLLECCWRQVCCHTFHYHISHVNIAVQRGKYAWSCEHILS